MKAKNANRELASGILFLLPNFLGFAVFTALPVLLGLVISFSDYNGFKQFSLVGFENYIHMFQDEYFRISLLNNIFFTATSVPLTILASLLMALALNKPISGGSAFKTVYFFPSITSMVAVGIIWSLLFNVSSGPVNAFLRNLGVQNPPGWLTSTKWAMFAVVLVSVWRGAGYYMVMILAGLKTIPGHLYEAADVDGANPFQKFWRITLPSLSPTMFLVTIMSIISSFQVFDLVSVMTKGGPGRATNVLVYRIYQEGFKYMKFGYASAMAYFLFLIILVVTLVQFRGQKKWVSYME